jgi:hypothetical protein
MKQFLLALMLVIASFAQAQFSMQWLGNNTISINSSGGCNADVRISWLSQAGVQKDSIVTVNAGAQINVILPGSILQGSEIKAKADAPCSSNGWIRILAGATVLPVAISAFAVHRSGNAVIINWQSSAPVNVERSTDGVHFKTIAVNLKSSTAVDLTPAAGVNYYRLKLAEGYSPIRKIEIVEVPTLAGVFTLNGVCMAKSLDAVPPGLYFVKYSDGECRGIVKR